MSNLPPLPDSALPNIVPPPTTNVLSTEKPIKTMEKAGGGKPIEIEKEKDWRPLAAVLFFILTGLGVAIYLVAGERIMGTFRGDIRQRASGPIGESSIVEQVNEKKTFLSEEATESAEINGLICAYGPTKQLAGKIIYFDYDRKIAYEKTIAENVSAYTVNVPTGRYVAFFKPDGVWPVYAYTQYVSCGLEPDTCTDHKVLLMIVEKNGVYGNIHLCDPQYEEKTKYSMLLTQ